MIDIYRFLNSKDVADYLRDMHFTFTAQQAAYFVDISTHVALSEKIRAWRSIVGEMPDEQIPAGKSKHDSARELINAHIADKEMKLKLFMNNEGSAFFPYESRWSELPSWVPETWYEEHGLWNTLTMPVPFASFDKCVAYLKEESQILETGRWHDNPRGEVHYDRHKICRAEIDKGRYCSYGHINDPDRQSTPLDYVELDENFEITDVAWGWDEEAIDYSVGAVPIPFQPGDIVIDHTSRVPHPFVFCAVLPWEKGNERFSPYGREKSRALLDELFDDPDSPYRSMTTSEHTMWGNHDWRLVAYGYEIDSRTGNIELKDYGACENYLNLEYYSGSLDGDLRRLAIVSAAMKGGLGPDEASNFNRLAALYDHLAASARSQ